MGTAQNVSKWGGSLAVRIPKPIAEQCGITEGDPIQLVVHGDGILIRKHNYDLKAMVSQITSSNIHHEQDHGTPLGKEQW